MTASPTILLISLFLITAITRVSPLAISSWLKKQWWINTLAKSFPYLILTLLILLDLEKRFSNEHISILATAVGIAGTSLAHHFMKRSILSIAIGVIFYNVASFYLT